MGDPDSASTIQIGRCGWSYRHDTCNAAARSRASVVVAIGRCVTSRRNLLAGRRGPVGTPAVTVFRRWPNRRLEARWQPRDHP